MQLRSLVPGIVLPLLLLPGLTSAQEERRLDGTISGSGSAFKIGVPAARYQGVSDAVATEIAQTVRDDLEFSGFFDLIDPQLYSLIPASEGDEERHDDWLSIGADAMLRLVVEYKNDRVYLEARLHDNQTKQMTFNRIYRGSNDFARRLAHQLADDLMRQFTGRPGVAMTRIAFSSFHEENKEVYIMDYDGQRVRRLTTSRSTNLSPVWSPDGKELAFTSWRGKQPGVYVMNNQGKLGHLDTVGGELSAAPDWSPDGRRLAYVSDVDGNSEIYILDRQSKRNSRVTRNNAIDTGPAWSPNGREIAFTSDRTGNPQVYLMDAEGLNARRVSFGSPYASSPAWSPRGEQLAYVSRIDGKFDVVVLETVTGQVRRLTHGEGNNENPRWSPDGRHLVFASSRAGRYDVYTMRADGSRVKRLTRGGDSFTPDWSR
ncbi:MAG: Tol-Pal system beta propeller repeat protein TolB [Acidobacteriota bacterium]|nr:Tol-Pal system beta propeller repeat protein TolB [Acidobacteriota bacterium]MDH3786738.1 Tol-Pal system beta propeller repeat protein TolB [Acidobacteriota bacterium]